MRGIFLGIRLAISTTAFFIFLIGVYFFITGVWDYRFNFEDILLGLALFFLGELVLIIAFPRDPEIADFVERWSGRIAAVLKKVFNPIRNAWKRLSEAYLRFVQKYFWGWTTFRNWVALFLTSFLGLTVSRWTLDEIAIVFLIGALSFVVYLMIACYSYLFFSIDKGFGQTWRDITSAFSTIRKVTQF